MDTLVSAPGSEDVPDWDREPDLDSDLEDRDWECELERESEWESERESDLDWEREREREPTAALPSDKWPDREGVVTEEDISNT